MLMSRGQIAWTSEPAGLPSIPERLCGSVTSHLAPEQTLPMPSATEGGRGLFPAPLPRIAQQDCLHLALAVLPCPLAGTGRQRWRQSLRITCRAFKNSPVPSSNSSSLVSRKGTLADMVCGRLVEFSTPHSPTGDSGCSPKIPTQTGLVTQKKQASFRFPRRSPSYLPRCLYSLQLLFKPTTPEALNLECPKVSEPCGTVRGSGGQAAERHFLFPAAALGFPVPRSGYPGANVRKMTFDQLLHQIARSKAASPLHTFTSARNTQGGGPTLHSPLAHPLWPGFVAGGAVRMGAGASSAAPFPVLPWLSKLLPGPPKLVTPWFAVAVLPHQATLGCALAGGALS